jgi:hypothetical protein
MTEVPRLRFQSLPWGLKLNPGITTRGPGLLSCFSLKFPSLKFRATVLRGTSSALVEA